MIHQYKLNGYNIVLDVYSGSVHAVDELANDPIALVDSGHPRAEAADLLAKKYADHPEVTAEDINDCFDDIEELKADGKLFAEDIYADHAFDFKNRSTVVKALCLHVAHTCNLNCEYCFAAQGIGITDEVIEWANKECYNVVLSLDGRKEINDRFRKDIAGRGSYDRIVPKFQQLVKARGGKGYYMRGTFTHYNTDFTNDLFHMADDLGFDELSMEPVVSKAGSPEALTEADLPILFDQYELLAKDMLRREKAGHPITFYHYMIDLAHGPCIYKRISGCGSGTEYMAVTPWGDLYPCHQFVGDPDYKLGDIWNGVTNTELRDEFKLCNVYARPDCKDCWARLYCAGGCAANALHATGDIHGVYEYGCEVFRKRIECALMIKVAESLDPELAGRAATAAPATDEDCGDCSSCE